MSQFKQTGKFPAKPYLGVQYQMISQQAAVLNNVPQGAYVVNIVAGSPAESAGIKANDIITKFDGQELTEEDTLADAIKKKSPGEAIELEIWRDGETLKLTVTLSEFSE